MSVSRSTNHITKERLRRIFTNLICLTPFPCLRRIFALVGRILDKKQLILNQNPVRIRPMLHSNRKSMRHIQYQGETLPPSPMLHSNRQSFPSLPFLPMHCRLRSHSKNNQKRCRNKKIGVWVRGDPIETRLPFPSPLPHRTLLW